MAAHGGEWGWKTVTRSPEVVLIIPDTAHVRPRNEPTTPYRPRFIGHYLVFNPVRVVGGGRSPPIQFCFISCLLLLPSASDTARLPGSLRRLQYSISVYTYDIFALVAQACWVRHCLGVADLLLTRPWMKIKSPVTHRPLFSWYLVLLSDPNLLFPAGDVFQCQALFSSQPWNC